MGTKLKKRKDGRYCRRIKLPTGDSKDVYGYTLKELEENVEKLRLEYALNLSPAKVTVAQWAEVWWRHKISIKSGKGKIGDRCKYDYLSALNNYILPEIGSIMLRDIRPVHCQAVIDSAIDKSLSQQRKLSVVMNHIFRYACVNQLLQGNPNQYTTLTARQPESVKALDPDQVADLLKAAKTLRQRLLVNLGLFAGLRRGEIAALRWTDVDLINRIINIRSSVDFLHNQPKNKDPKSKAGYRSIPIIPQLYDLLIEVRGKTRSEFVLPAADDIKQMSDMSIRRLWESIIRHLNFHCTTHQMRHTFSTTLHKLDFDPKLLQYLMGHADIKTTYRVYTDIQRQQIDKAAERMKTLFSESQAS